jgi:hypothetical protein
VIAFGPSRAGVHHGARAGAGDHTTRRYHPEKILYRSKTFSSLSENGRPRSSNYPSNHDAGGDTQSHNLSRHVLTGDARGERTESPERSTARLPRSH